MQRKDELRIVKFRRIPGLIRIIWDAHWDALHHGSPASIRFAIYVEEKIDVEAPERAPCQVQIMHIVEAIGKVEELDMYSAQARMWCGFEGQGLHMRMVPSGRLEEFYDGRLLAEWSGRGH